MPQHQPLGHSADKVLLMAHKATVALNCGLPAQTIATGMQEHSWVPKQGNVPAGYSRTGATKVASHRLHVLEECQAWVTHMPAFFKKFENALHQEGLPVNAPALLRRCPHVFSMDPLQSPCRMYGVARVSPNGQVEFKPNDVVMPWKTAMAELGEPSAQVKWHVLLLHGQFRMKGLLFRLLRHVYVPPMPWCWWSRKRARALIVHVAPGIASIDCVHNDRPCHTCLAMQDTWRSRAPRSASCRSCNKLQVCDVLPARLGTRSGGRGWRHQGVRPRPTGGAPCRVHHGL